MQLQQRRDVVLPNYILVGYIIPNISIYHVIQMTIRISNREIRDPESRFPESRLKIKTEK